MATGYLDRTNHALAFAAKHNDRQVRKGTRLPYRTHAANVAIILTRYGQDEETVLAGILYDVVEDSIRERSTREVLERRVGDKFGIPVLDTLITISERLTDDEGVELSQDERKDDCLVRLETTSERGRWVYAAHHLHNGSVILADLKRTLDADSVWNRFHQGKAWTIDWYARVYRRLREVGFATEIMAELQTVVERLDELVEPAARR